MDRIDTTYCKVLPACAGVILADMMHVSRKSSFTRMRGGDPDTPIFRNFITRFYPHARG